MFKFDNILQQVFYFLAALLIGIVFFGLLIFVAKVFSTDAEASDSDVLVEGWNLVGGKEQNIQEFWERYPMCPTVWTWESEPGREYSEFTWHGSFQGEPLTENSVTYMSYDQGYWIYCE